VRTYLAFIGPYNETGSYPWNPDGIVGVRRFLEKVWRLQNKVHQGDTSNTDSQGVTLVHQTVKKVEESLRQVKMNTAVSALMILSNDFEKRKEISKEEYETLLILLAPFAPHMTEEVWARMGHKGSVHTEAWPKYDESKFVSDSVTLAVQINGKVRATLEVQIGQNEEEIVDRAMALPEVSKWLDGQKPKKIIVVSGKVVSIVL
jgi:leucyl-tRNA synthetase